MALLRSTTTTSSSSLHHHQRASAALAPPTSRRAMALRVLSGPPPAASILRRSSAGIRSSTINRRAAANAALQRPRALLSVFAAPQKTKPTSIVPPDCQKAQDQILAALSSAKGRGREGLSAEQLESLDAAVTLLEQSAKGQPDAASQPSIDGRWRLVFTSRPGSASPIQRTFVGVDSFSVFQDVSVADEAKPPRVDNVVVFGKNERDAWGFLRVEAEASTQARPLEGFTPRQGAGLPLFGKSFNTPPAAGPGSRIDFAFDRAAFNLLQGRLKVPYPVPFRLLGDETKGWLDVTYLSRDGKFRLSRGNKGTLFVLLKEEEDQEEAGVDGAENDEDDDAPAEASSSSAPAPTNPFARLFLPAQSNTTASTAPAVADVLAAARASAAAPSDAEKARKALELVEQLVEAQGKAAIRKPARNAKAVHGKWRLIWTQQSKTASALQRWGASQAKSYQLIDALDRGLAMNVVDLRPVAEVRAYARCQPLSDTRTGVRIESGDVVFAPPKAGKSEGGLRFALPIKGSNDGYVEWLYLDDSVRVTRGSKGSLFLHVRESDDATAIPDF